MSIKEMKVDLVRLLLRGLEGFRERILHKIWSRDRKVHLACMGR